MIGCDIIDLAYTRVHNNWQRKGFLNKVFTDKEQSLIHNSSDPFNTVWRLWSMKESAYKAHSSLNHTRVFNPSKLVCQIIDDTRGHVHIDSHIYPTITKFNEQYIFTTTSSDQEAGLQCAVIELDNSKPQYQSKACHDALLRQICKNRKWNRLLVDIQKTQHGIPFIIHDGKKQDIEVSVSHHGRHGGYLINTRIKEKSTATTQFQPDVLLT